MTRVSTLARSLVPLAVAGALAIGFGCTTKTVNTTSVGFVPDGGLAQPGGRPGVNPPSGGIDDPGGCPTTPPETLSAPGDLCVCAIECATGACVGGVCCAAAACVGQRPLGGSCEVDTECQSGFCADGVCCNVACSGACVACDLPDREGECSPVPAGSPDLHDVCRHDSPETCGQSGVCNGQGGCAKYAIGTTCRLPTCQGRDQFVPASLCDGEGVCVAGVSISCQPSSCEGGNCLNSCTTNDQCRAPASCVAGSCGPKGIGQDCARNEQCQSGACVDGVCCENACTGKCQFCANPDARGRCVPVRSGAADPRAARGEDNPDLICIDEGPASCGSNGRCNGQRGCQSYPEGTVCREASCDGTANTETPAGTCREGACRIPGARSCVPYRGCSGSSCRNACGSDGQCAAGNVCTAGDCGKRPAGALCSRATECASAICAQGRCCNSACTGTCLSCALPGREGVCSNVGVGGADPAGACRNDACSNGCDGAGGCRRESGGVLCGGAPTCGGNVRTFQVCTAAGVCEPRTQACSGATPICAPDGCLAPAPKGPGEGCLRQADCRGGLSCAPNGLCCDEACVGPCDDGCNANGNGCRTRALGFRCGDGRVCNAAGQCVIVDPCAGINCGTHGTCGDGACACRDGFIGNRCQTPPDPCAGINCGVNGSCNNGVCECRNGFRGNRCQTAPPPADPCQGVICGDHGTCVAGSCVCRDGFRGNRCQNPPPVDLCAGVDCGEHGSCVAGACVCRDGFRGARCMNPPPVDPCMGINCGEHGSCAAGACICRDGFRGNRCQNPPPPIDLCAGIDCGEHGSCTAGRCLCRDGFRGPRCMNPPPVDPCTGIDCGEHGSCAAGACICRDGFRGNRCQNPPPVIDLCAGIDCGAHGDCTAGRCICRDGFQGNRCQNSPPVDACIGVDCGAHGDCNNGRCRCRDGFQGPACQVPPLPPIDLCRGIDCGANGSCTLGRCICRNGFRGIRCETPPGMGGGGGPGGGVLPPGFPF